MDTIHVRIEGHTPLLMNKFTDKAQQAADARTAKTLVGKRETPAESAESKIYFHGDEIVMPQPNLFRAIIDAGKFIKAGKSKVTTQKSSLVPAGCAIDVPYIPLEHKQAWTVDTRPVRNPSTGGRILSHRARFDDWALSFDLMVDPEVFDPATVRDLLDYAGSRVGLGDFRPDCKGPFGKFKVTRWEVEKV